MEAIELNLGNVRLVAERNALNAVVEDQHVIMRRMGEEIAWARRVINKGVDLMPLEQLSQWEGVRAWLEGVESDIEYGAEAPAPEQHTPASPAQRSGVRWTHC